MADENKPASKGPLFNLSISDLLGGGKGIEKLADTVGSGAGRLVDGVSRVADAKWLNKVDADNEAYRITKIGAANTQVLQERVRALTALANEAAHLQSVNVTETGVSAQFIGLSPEMRELQERARQRVAYENIMQQINQETVITHAAVELSEEEEISDEPVEPDWLTRFFRTVRDISSEEMQLIWGKILAGEVKEPGRFSPRTLDFLATLTKGEALIFQRVCAFNWQAYGKPTPIIPEFNTGNYGLDVPSYSELQHLENIGLIVFSTASGFSYGTKEISLSYAGSIITVGVKALVTEPSIEVGMVSLTKIGEELANVCQSPANPCIMEYMMEYWMTRNYQVSCSFEVQPPEPAVIL